MSSLDKELLHVYSREYAVSLDAQDPLRTRNQFLIPSKGQLRTQSLPEAVSRDSDISDDAAVYLCGNSLGLQPRITSVRMQQYFSTWATQGVFGHFKPLAESPLPTWLDADTQASESMAPIIGALPSEVVVMQTLTSNLHQIMSAFYKPDINGRHKIIIENQAFPSDHFAAESQILHHDLDPATSLVTIKSPSQSHTTLSTSHILSVIAEHGPTTSVLLLPGIQYYTGQFFDIPKITEAARAAGIFVVWDLAHAVGNVILKLHDWNVDAAVWCSYKYVNAGPGAAGGLFIHENNSKVATEGEKKFTNRLSGWWGSDKSSRFDMDNKFVPIPGAAGFQLSNPSILDITSVNASLEVFAKAGGMTTLRGKSIRLTAYLEALLVNMKLFRTKIFEIITPNNKEDRGAQLSLKLESGLLEAVMEQLVRRGIVMDERRPDVIRVAPAPLYNNFEDCWKFVEAFGEALNTAIGAKVSQTPVKGTSKLEKTT